MKNRKKHHKETKHADTYSKHNNTSADIQNVDAGNDQKSSRKSSNSRSRSRSRRSLSSLFRKSAPRNESSDRDPEKVFIDDTENMDSSVADINLRIDPRGHLQRMTVREALVYNRNRGRSPNRRALKLEKTILDDVTRSKSTEDLLSSSMPHLLDQISDNNLNDVDRTTLKHIGKGVSTLPRAKKKHSDGRVTFEKLKIDHSDPDSLTKLDSDIKQLPLDKRKYIINRDIPGDNVENHSSQGDSVDAHISLQQHSRKRDDELPYINADSEVGRRRRETYEQFLTLRETKPSHIASQSIAETLPKTPLINVSKSPTLDSIAQTGGSFDVHAQVHKNTVHENETELSLTVNDSNTVDKYDHNADMHTTVNTDDDIVCTGNISRQVSTASTDKSRSRRSSYVSPRRFSRTSRTSVTSNKSSVSDTSNQSAIILNDDTTAQKKVLSEGPKGRYMRQFSKDSRKSITIVPEQISKVMVDKETSTEGTSSIRELVDSSTQTIDTENVKTSCVKDCQTDISNRSPQYFAETDEQEEIVNEQAVIPRNISSLQREIVVIEQGKPGRHLGRQSLDSLFKPIRIAKHRKGSDIIIDNTDIEVLEDVKEIQQNDKIKRKSGKKKSKKDKNKKKSSVKNKHKSEDDDGFEIDASVCKTIKKRPSETQKGNTSKETVDSDCKDDSFRKADVHTTTCIKTDRKSKKENNKSERKPRSILRRSASKEPSGKSIPEALRRVGRAASLSEVFESMESIRKEDIKNKQDRKLKKKLSRSLDSINKEADESFQESLKHLKEANAKKAKRNSHPKISLVGVVALKSRIARLKKKKKDTNIETTEMDNTDTIDTNPNVENDDATIENDDLHVAKVYYENEINTSIGKSTNSIDISEVTDQEVKNIVYEKRIQFSAPYCDDVMTEEELIKQRQRNTRLTSRRESKVRLRQKKVISCCKKFVAFLFSHIGLCSLVVAYCILGGIIFKELEGAHEIEKKKEMTELRQNFTERIHRLAFETTLTKGNREIFKTQVNAILKNFSVIIHKQTKEAGWDGQEIREVINSTTQIIEPEQWSYPSSLLYAITVMTTIGYGHVAPKTDEGRIMTIAYAVLGIPLTLLCLTNIGDVMAHGFRMLYDKVCCGVCCILFKPRRRRRLDPEKGIHSDRIIMEEEEKSTEVVHVPTSVCLLLMTSYIMLGTILFSYWESWDIVTGTYFCFITLSTIGFGDVVPGMSQKDWNQHEKLVSCALYLVLGLSLIAMCFNLVQEDVKAKCKWLGMKLGLIDKPVSSV